MLRLKKEALWCLSISKLDQADYSGFNAMNPLHGSSM